MYVSQKSFFKYTDPDVQLTIYFPLPLSIMCPHWGLRLFSPSDLLPFNFSQSLKAIYSPGFCCLDL